jgi:hypothetical protein
VCRRRGEWLRVSAARTFLCSRAQEPRFDRKNSPVGASRFATLSDVYLATKRTLAGLFILTLSSCVAVTDADEAQQVSSQEQAIVYGDDDRQDLYQVEDPVIRELARSSMAALIKSNAVHRLSSGMVRVDPLTLKETYDLCDGQRFENQPAAATCSAVLIDKDLVITAGHCVETQDDCKTYSLVFDYAYDADGQLEEVSGSDVYSCRRLVSRTFTETAIDYSIVQLDRVPSTRTPIPIRRATMHVAEPVVALGFTSGLPLKVDRGAAVQDARSLQFDYFTVNTDTFKGSSGSAVLDENYELAGVLVRGGNDYEDTGHGCAVANVVSSDAGMPEWRWEQATYAAAAINALCAEGYPSQLLCDLAPSCGDGVCSLDPVDENCPEDCEEFCRVTACSKGVGSAVPGKPVPPKSKGDSEGCSVRAPGGSAADLLPSVLWTLLGLAYVTRRSGRSAPSGARAKSRSRPSA